MMIHKSKALAGAAILGDGRVGLILDVHGLGQQDRQPLSKAA
jgi:chemotaxis protein histidine kinase CheA